MIFQYNCYREWLKSEINQKIKDNPLFSANSFARKLGISQSYLSLVLNNKRDFNDKLAKEISEKMRLSEIEKEYFSVLVQLSNAKTHELKKYFNQQLLDIRKKSKITQIDIALFEIVSDWKVNTVYTYLAGKYSNTIVIDENTFLLKTKISKDDFERSIQKLIEANLIKQEGDCYVPSTSSYIETPSEVSSKALKKFHKEIAKKAIFAIENQSIEERCFNGSTMPIDKNKLPEAKKMIQNFIKELHSYLEIGENKCEEIYQLEISLFRLEENNNEIL